MSTDNKLKCEVCYRKISLIECGYCKYGVCESCCEKFLLGIEDDRPRCMHPDCMKVWSGQFLFDNFSKSFNKRYADRQADILISREKSLMPATQHLVQKIQKDKELDAEIKKLDEANDILRQSIMGQINANVIKMNKLRNQKSILKSKDSESKSTYTIACPINDCKGYIDADDFKCGICKIYVCKKCHVVKNGKVDTDHKCDEGTKETVKLLKKDTKNCPNCQVSIHKINGCFAGDTKIMMWDGSIKEAKDIEVDDELMGDDNSKRIVQKLTRGTDTMYKIIQEKGDNYVVNSMHTLVLKVNDHEGCEINVNITVKEYLELSAYAKKLLVGFKSNCSLDITTFTVENIGVGEYFGWSVDCNQKFVLKDLTVVHNCSQMFCTKCHTAFSWDTGKIETGVIHNPHWYELQRKLGGLLVRRTVGDVQCGGIPDVMELVSAVSKVTNINMYNLHQLIHHLQYVELGRHPVLVGHQDETDLRVKYMMNDIDEKTWKSKLKKKIKKRAKDEEINAILTTFINVVSDMFRNIITAHDKDQLRLYITHIDTIKEYTNLHLRQIGRRFGNMVPQIATNWGMHNWRE